MRSSRFVTFGAAFILALSIFVAAIIVGTAFKKSREGDDTIRVTGAARRIVHSDYIIWDAQLDYQSTTVADAYSHLTNGSTIFLSYLAQKGVQPSEIFPMAIKTNVLYQKTQSSDSGTDDTIYRQIQGYRLSQTIEVRSRQIQLIEAVSQSATDLIKQGVALNSKPPQYLITNLADIKDSMLLDAAKDARVRAKEIASSSSTKLGELRYSHMGAMTVNGAYAVDQPEGSGEDTSSVDKRVTVEVTSAFDLHK